MSFGRPSSGSHAGSTAAAPFNGPLSLALGLSVALHVAMMLSLGGARLPQLPRAEPVMAVLSLALAGTSNVPAEPAPAVASLPDLGSKVSHDSPAPPHPPLTEQAASRQGILFDPPRYYRSSEVDVRARPMSMATTPRSERTQVARQLVAYKLELFINELGTIDRVEVLEPKGEGEAHAALLEDVKELRFHPAQRGGVAVPSRKLIELSFVP